MTRIACSLLWIAVLAACASPTPGGSACREGSSIGCACDDGRPGTRSCGADACVCPEAEALVAEPATVDFGAVAVGMSRDAVVRVRNPAPRAIELGEVAVHGDAAAYSLPEGRPWTVPAGGTVAVTVRFAPTARGTPAATLRIGSRDAAVTGVDVPLVGRVRGATLACTPAEVAFAETTVGDRAVATVVCTNLGPAGAGDEERLPLTRLETTGEGFSAAWRDAPPEGGLAAGESASIELAFAPAAPGDHPGTLIVGGDAGDAFLPLRGSATDGPPCDLAIVPDRLRFAILQPGHEDRVPVQLQNLGTGDCTVRDLRLCAGTDSAFTLVDGADDRVVLPGRSLHQLDLRFAPTAASCPRPDAGCIEFEVEPSAEGHREIPIVCDPSEPAVLVAPSDLDFGSLQPGCEVRDLEVTAIDIVSTPVVFAGAELTGSGEFYLRSTPPIGAAIEPGLAETLVVAYRPEDQGDDVGTLRIRFAGEPEPYVVTLRGHGAPPDLQRDRFVIGPRPMVDVLLVIDNGASMAPESARIVAELGGLPDRLREKDLDFHLAVTTTGLAPGGPGCPGGVQGGEDGRLFPVDGARPRVLDATTPDLRATWEANLAVGACQDAPPQAIEATVRAVTAPAATSADDPRHPEPNDGNLGFWRQAAHLSVIAITNRADASPGSANTYYNTLMGLKGYRNTHLFNFHAIAGDRGTGCTTADGRSAAAGDALLSWSKRPKAGRSCRSAAPDGSTTWS